MPDPAQIAMPRTNSAYWTAKLERNVARDTRNAAALDEAGWTLLIVWEHEDAAAAADRVEAAIRESSP